MLIDVALLKCFRPFFTKPSFNHFQKYIQGLMIGEKGKKNINAINSIFMDYKNQSSLNRFLTEYKWDEGKLNEVRIRNFLKRKNNGILILDDSLIGKTGKRMEGVGFLFDHAKRKHILCHNFVSTHYVNREQLPLHLEMYVKKGVAESTGMEFKTKVEIALELLKDSFGHTKPFVTVFDAWYLCKRIVDFMGKRKWVSRTKLNRLVLRDDEWVSLKQFIGQIKKFRHTQVEISDEKYRCITSMKVKMKSIGIVKLVILKKKVNSKKAIALVTNSDLGDDTVLEIFKRRFNIEVFYRDCKQHLGLGDYQLRDMHGVVKHLHLVFLAYSILRDARVVRFLSSFLKRGVKTIGDCCRALKKRFLEYFIQKGIELYKLMGDVKTTVTTIIDCLT